MFQYMALTESEGPLWEMGSTFSRRGGYSLNDPNLLMIKSMGNRGPLREQGFTTIFDFSLVDLAGKMKLYFLEASNSREGVKFSSS